MQLYDRLPSHLRRRGRDPQRPQNVEVQHRPSAVRNSGHSSSALRTDHIRPFAALLGLSRCARKSANTERSPDGADVATD